MEGYPNTGKSAASGFTQVLITGLLVLFAIEPGKTEPASERQLGNKTAHEHLVKTFAQACLERLGLQYYLYCDEKQLADTPQQSGGGTDGNPFGRGIVANGRTFGNPFGSFKTVGMDLNRGSFELGTIHSVFSEQFPKPGTGGNPFGFGIEAEITHNETVDTFNGLQIGEDAQPYGWDTGTTIRLTPHFLDKNLDPVGAQPWVAEQ